MAAKFWYVPAITLCLSAAVSAADDQAVSLAEKSQWEINYDDDSCHLLGKCGEGADAITLNITRYQPGDAFDFTLYGTPMKLDAADYPAVDLQFGENPVGKGYAITGTLGKALPMVIFPSRRFDGWRSSPNTKTPQIGPKITPEQEAAIQFISVRLPGGKAYRLETGAMSDPMAAMRSCTTDLVKHWGYDPAEQASIETGPTPKTPAYSWVSTRDYPTEALRIGANGLVRFRLDVDPAGQITSCSVLFRTKPDEFADMTCALLRRRGKFEPARDKSGKPVRSFYTNMIRFAIPEE